MSALLSDYFALPAEDGLRIPMRLPENFSTGSNNPEGPRYVEMRGGQAYTPDNKPVLVTPSKDGQYDVIYELEKPNTLLVKIPKPSWYDKHVQSDDNGLPQGAVEWMMSPERGGTRRLMIQFPPSCIVRALVKLEQPKPWEYGILYAYSEPDEKNPFGQVSVQVPNSGRKHHSWCKPEWLQIVDYWRGLTPDRVRRIFDGSEFAKL